MGRTSRYARCEAPKRSCTLSTTAANGQSQRNKETGEPDDATSIKSGSAGGWEKRPKGPRSQPTQLRCSKAGVSCVGFSRLIHQRLSGILHESFSGPSYFHPCITPTVYVYEMINSTRRFCCRPTAVSFEATGDAFPYPRVAICAVFTPFWLRKSRTASARRWERSRL